MSREPEYAFESAANEVATEIAAAVQAVADAPHDPAARLALDELLEHVRARDADDERADERRKLRDRLQTASTEAAAAAAAGDEKRAANIAAQARDIARELTPKRTEATCFGLEDALAADLPATDWICESLQLCEGRPAMFIGYAGSGKTYAAIALLLALVFKRAVWGCADFEPSRDRKLRGLWVDFELGPKASKKILRKLARGMKIGEREICEARRELGARPLEVERSNELKLGPGRFEQLEAALATFVQRWTARLRGYDVVVIDSLRRLAPFLNEKDSEMGGVIDALRAASEATGCVVILLHHAVKMGGSIASVAGSRDGRKAARPVRPVEEMGSGSGAIDAGAGAQFFFQKDGAARLITHGRPSVEADRPQLEPFYLAMENVIGPGGAAVTIVHRTKDEVYPPKPKPNVASETAEREAAVLAAVEKNPGISVTTLGLVLQKAGKGMRPNTLADLVSGMCGINPPLLVNAGGSRGGGPSRNGAKLYIPGAEPAHAPSPEPAQEPKPARPKRRGAHRSKGA